MNDMRKLMESISQESGDTVEDKHPAEVKNPVLFKYGKKMAELRDNGDWSATRQLAAEIVGDADLISSVKRMNDWLKKTDGNPFSPMFPEYHKKLMVLGMRKFGYDDWVLYIGRIAWPGGGGGHDRHHLEDIYKRN